MNPRLKLALLGGLSPAEFMRRHWQREPKLIRQAVPGFKPPVSTAGLKRLAKRDDVQSRLIWRENAAWQMEHGPFARLPKASARDWTLLLQSVDLHDDAVAELMHRFRFVPDARLDDVMISLAGDGGGVGPHFDSYDVFLLQAQGVRRWRIGRQRDLSLAPGLPLKILSRFEPEAEYDLEPGDMLYLPPDVAHEGVAVGGDCMTISIGFRAPTYAELARGMLETAAEQVHDDMPAAGRARRGQASTRLYRDPDQPATAAPACVPDGLVQAALAAVGRVPLDEALATRYLGIWLTEPGPDTVFEGAIDGGGGAAGGKGARDRDGIYRSNPDHAALRGWPGRGSLQLDRRTRMMYRGAQVFINGELAPLRANALLRRLADERALPAEQVRAGSISDELMDLLAEWAQAGWLRPDASSDDK